MLTVRVTSVVVGAAIAIALSGTSFTSLFYLAAIDLGVGLQPEKERGADPGPFRVVSPPLIALELPMKVKSLRS